MRSTVMLFLACIIHASSYCAVFQKLDSASIVLDSIAEDIVTEEPMYTYWKPRYYDSIPVIDRIPAADFQSYETMIPRYQSKDFEYVESISQKLNFMDELLDRFNRFLRSLFPRTNMEFNDGFYTIMGIVGGAIFLFLIYKLFFSGKKVYIKLEEEGEDEEEQIAFVERNLVQVDLHHYIREALTKENYAMAVRYQQLLNIQTLHEKGYIQWKHTKTNMELMEDMANKELKEEFLFCASLFDRVWFGNRAIGGQEYEHIAQHFKHFQQKWA